MQVVSLIRSTRAKYNTKRRLTAVSKAPPSKMSREKSAERRVNFSNILPPEMILEIVKQVDIMDYLSLKLSCKALAAHMPQTLRTLVKTLPTPREFIETDGAHNDDWYAHYCFHHESVTRLLHSLEDKMRIGSPSACRVPLLCNKCDRHKPLSSFVDAHRAPVNFRAFDEHRSWITREYSDYEPYLDTIDYDVLELLGHAIWGHLDSRACLDCMKPYA